MSDDIKKRKIAVEREYGKSLKRAIDIKVGENNAKHCYVSCPALQPDNKGFFCGATSERLERSNVNVDQTKETLWLRTGSCLATEIKPQWFDQPQGDGPHVRIHKETGTMALLQSMGGANWDHSQYVYWPVPARPIDMSREVAS